MSYNRELVERLLPAVWDEDYAYGAYSPTAPDPDMPRGSMDISHGGILYAHLADIRYAWRRTPLEHEARVALLLRYGLDWNQREIAAAVGAGRSTVSGLLLTGVGRIVAHLNGEHYGDGGDP